MLVDAGFGKSFLVLDKNQAGWLYALLMEFVSTTGGDFKLYPSDVQMCKTIAGIIEAGDASYSIVPRTGSNPIWLEQERRQRA